MAKKDNVIHYSSFQLASSSTIRGQKQFYTTVSNSFSHALEISRFMVEST